MPLQFFEFSDLPLQFVILELCHYNFTSLQNMPLHTPSTCFLKSVDQNTLYLLLPLIPSFLPLSPWQNCRCRPAPPQGSRPTPRVGGCASAEGSWSSPPATSFQKICSLSLMRRGRSATMDKTKEKVDAAGAQVLLACIRALEDKT